MSYKRRLNAGFCRGCWINAIEESLSVQLSQTASVESLPLTQTAIVGTFIAGMTQTALPNQTLQAVSTPLLQWPSQWPTAIPAMPTPLLQWPTLYPVWPTQYPYPLTPVPGICNSARFIADLSYPDDSIVNPEQTFVKTWRIQNIGQCTWTPIYTIINQQTGQVVSPMVDLAVPPGGMADISLRIAAPQTQGNFQVSYLFRSADGSVFGTGLNGMDPLFVNIYVNPGFATEYPQTRTRIQFAPGAFSASRAGSLDAYEINGYVLRAVQGQKMVANVISTHHHVMLTIFGVSDGRVLVRGSENGATSWQGRLPATQDYAMDVISDGNPADYELVVEIH